MWLCCIEKKGLSLLSIVMLMFCQSESLLSSLAVVNNL